MHIFILFFSIEKKSQNGKLQYKKVVHYNSQNKGEEYE